MNTNEIDMNRRARLLALCILVAGVLWTLIVNGAVPFAGMPTMGQAASMMGYAQAFADQHWYSIHARSFGFPVPTSLATGLPLAWLAGWFVRLGLKTSDAYGAAAAIWLIAGYVGAYRLARRLGEARSMGALGAASWMTLPMIWAHQSYSSLALGMAMLPLYLCSAVALFDLSATTMRRVLAVLVFVFLCVVALFMDGYTFMMFAVAAMLFLSSEALARKSPLRVVALQVVPVYLLGFSGAYLLYTAYMGRSAFAAAPLEFFRAWGLDLLFLAKPPQGEFLLWDWMGWGGVRSDSVFFGDASVWLTTFALPLAIVGLGCFLALRKHEKRAWLLIVIAMFGLYMSLGPTVKFGAVKPEGANGPFMQAASGLMPTGNAFFSEHVPGFRAMRASYRWEALFLLGMWGLVVLGAAHARPGQRRIWVGVYLILIISSMPHLGDMWSDYRSYRRDLATIDRDVSAPLAARLREGSKVFFVPFNNDVMANYLSPRLKVLSYNIGGDKQIEIAREQWPVNLRKFAMNRFDASDVLAIRVALLERDADAVIIPYFDSLWAAHLWPCVAEAKGYSSRTLALFGANTAFLCPGQIKAAYAANVRALSNDAVLTVEDLPLFAIVKLNPSYVGDTGSDAARASAVSVERYPMDVIKDGGAADAVLGEGWNDPEPANRWSRDRADLTIPVTAECQQGGCVAEFQIVAFAATLQRPVSVSATITNAAATEAPAVDQVMTDDAIHTVAVPVPAGRDVITVRLDVPAATSPAGLGMSTDARMLGVSLRRIDMRRR